MQRFPRQAMWIIQQWSHEAFLSKSIGAGRLWNWLQWFDSRSWTTGTHSNMPTLVLAKLDPGSHSSLGNIAGGWGQGGGQGARVGGRNYLVLSLHRGRGLGARASGPCLLGLLLSAPMLGSSSQGPRHVCTRKYLLPDGSRATSSVAACAPPMESTNSHDPASHTKRYAMK